MTKFHNRTYHFHEFLGLTWQPNTSREQKSQRSLVNSSNKWATPSWTLTKFWKSKVSFEKSKTSNFGNQKCQLRNQNASHFENQKCYLRNQSASNFGNQKCHLRNQARQILEIKNAFEKSNATNFGNQNCYWRNQT